MNKVVQFSLPEDTKEKLDIFAEKRGYARLSELARVALYEYVRRRGLEVVKSGGTPGENGGE